MKTGIVMHKKSLNIGDDIQSLAAYKLLGKPDYILDRENLNNPGIKEDIKLLCNGWFMENPQNWPPAPNIHPLFISMHITHNNNATKFMLDKKLVNYYKKHEPIGCRDYHTVRLFENIGIKAYYSGCLTLTLENKFSDKDRTDEILFVDVFNKNLPQDLRNKYFRQLVPPSIEKNIEIIYQSHNNPDLTTQERFKVAESLIERYSKAHLVVTSRIHCALPCVALGTPVLFLDVGFNTANSRNRFEGITKYFHVINNRHFPFSGIDPISLVVRRTGLYKYINSGKKINFDWENPPVNPIDIKPITQKIRKSVSDL